MTEDEARRLLEQARPLLSEAGRIFAARRRTVETACAYCGKSITGTTRRKWCSVRCKVAALRQRRRQQRAEGPPQAPDAPA